MLLQWSSPEYMPHSFQVSGLSGTIGYKQTGNCFDLTKQVADGLVNMQELSKGLFLVQSEMAFKKETELCEEYPERKVFQLSFCMNGICEWNIGNQAASAISFPQHSAACSAERFRSA